MTGWQIGIQSFEISATKNGGATKSLINNAFFVSFSSGFPPKTCGNDDEEDMRGLLCLGEHSLKTFKRAYQVVVFSDKVVINGMAFLFQDIAAYKLFKGSFINLGFPTPFIEIIFHDNKVIRLSEKLALIKDTSQDKNISIHDFEKILSKNHGIEKQYITSREITLLVLCLFVIALGALIAFVFHVDTDTVLLITLPLMLAFALFWIFKNRIEKKPTNR